MSLQTWINEFVPEPPHVPKTDLHRLKRDLNKWIGLRPDNLIKHAVVVKPRFKRVEDGVRPDDYYYINGDSCSLCYQYYKTTASLSCKHCPLKEVRGVSCDNTLNGEQISPYGMWIHNGNPEPMIYLIEKALEALEEEGYDNGGATAETPRVHQKNGVPDPGRCEGNGRV